MSTDYVRRIIEEIRAALGGIIAKQHGGNYAEARAGLNTKCLETVGLDLNHVLRLSPEALGDLLATSGGLRYSRALTLAELLLLDASITEARGTTSGDLLNYLHAFCLIADSIPALVEKDEEIYRSRLDFVASRLQAFRGNKYVDDKLRDYERSPPRRR